jgi:hypothetical protein
VADQYIGDLTDGVAPQDSDEFPAERGGASNVRLSWAYFKAALKTYFDTLYPSGSGTSSGTNTGDQLVFKTIAVSGQSDVVADTATDTLTLVAGSNVTITTDAATDSITIAASGGGGSSPTVVSVTPSGTQDDYSPGTFTTLRIAGTGAVIITGLVAASDGEQKTIRNTNTTAVPVVLCHENAGSTAANRFTLTTGVSRGHLVLWPGDSCVIEYDGTAARWVLVSVSSAREAWVRRSCAANPNDVSISVFGMLVSAVSGMLAAAIGTGSYLAACVRVLANTTTTINTLAVIRNGNSSLSVGDAAGRGGFLVRKRFGFATVPGAAATFFAGARAAATLVGTSDFSGQLTNTATLGFGLDSGQSTLRLWKAGTGVAIDTSNDLGSNFPFSAGTCYEIQLFMPPNGGAAGWVIARTDDLTIAPKAGYETGGIPLTTDRMTILHAIANRAAAQYQSAIMSYDQFTPN